MSYIPEPVDTSFNFGVNDLVTLKGNRRLGLRELKIKASEKKALDQHLLEMRRSNEERKGLSLDTFAIAEGAE